MAYRLAVARRSSAFRALTHGRGPTGLFAGVSAVLVAAAGMVLGSTPGAPMAGAASRPAPLRPAVTAPPPANVGPAAPTDARGGEHWHAAYGIYVCGEYLPPIDGSGFPDPEGIHTHDDGLIHIHPFVPGAAGRKATLDRFLRAAHIVAKPGRELRFPDAGGSIVTYRDGDRCPDGAVGHVSVIAFPKPGAKGPAGLILEPSTWHLEHGQAIAFAFTADSATVTQPPSRATLDDPDDIAYQLSAKQRVALGASPPKFRFPAGPVPKKLRLDDLERGVGDPLVANGRVSFVYVLMSWDNRAVIDSSWGAGTVEPATVRLGRGTGVAWLEQTLLGHALPMECGSQWCRRRWRRSRVVHPASPAANRSWCGSRCCGSNHPEPASRSLLRLAAAAPLRRPGQDQECRVDVIAERLDEPDARPKECFDRASGGVAHP